MRTLPYERFSMKARHYLFAAFLTVLAGECMAQERLHGVYVGIDGGDSYAPSSCDGLPGGISCGTNATAVRGRVGFQINPIWAAEVSYTDFGSFNANGVYQGTPFNSQARAYAFEVAGVGTLPINPSFGLTGRLGIANTDLNEGGYGSFGSVSSTTTTLAAGVGLKYNLSRQAALHLNYDYYGNVGDSATTGTSSLSALTVGLTFLF